MEKYSNPLRKLKADEPVFFLPPFKVEQVFTALSENIDWGLQLLNIPNFWKHTKGAGVNVAVLDTGIARNHPDLRDAILDAKDFTQSPSGYADENGHGTHCAGIIAARNNGHGVIGVAPKCNLLIAKVLDDNGAGNVKNIVRGIEWALASGADILSMSLGSNAHFPAIHNALKEVIKEGKFVICAAGNDGYHLDTVDFPAKYEEVIAVGAIDRNRQVTSYSSKGFELDIVAPGDNITSTFPPNIISKMSGTSMAAPFVAGVAALVLSKHRQYGGNTQLENQKDLLTHLTKTAIDLGPTGFDLISGYGLINPGRILKLAKEKTLPEL